MAALWLEAHFPPQAPGPLALEGLRMWGATIWMVQVSGPRLPPAPQQLWGSIPRRDVSRFLPPRLSLPKEKCAPESLAPWGAGEVGAWSRGGCLLAAFPRPAAPADSLYRCCVLLPAGPGQGGLELPRAPALHLGTSALLATLPAPGAGELAHEPAPTSRTLDVAKGLTLHGPAPQTALLAPG